MASIEKQVLGTYGADAFEVPYDARNYDTIRIYARNWTADDPNANNLICTAPLTDPAKFKVTPKYTTFGTFLQHFKGGTAEALASFGQYSMMSKERETMTGNIDGAKLYAGTSDMEYSFNFRLLEGLNQNGERPTDWTTEEDCTGWSIIPLFYFNLLGMPKLNSDSMKMLNNVFDQLSKQTIGGAFGAAWNVAKLLGTSAWKSTKLAGQTVFSSVSPAASANLKYPSDQFAYRLRNTIDIEVSSIGILNNMVLTGYGATFSREVLSNGLPVYVDYSISVSPIVQPTRDEANERHLGTLMKLLGYSSRANMDTALHDMAVYDDQG